MIRLEYRHSVNTYYIYRAACAIPEEDSLVITGGLHTLRTVSRYSITGWVGDLAELNVGRRNHGCSSYYKDVAQVSICNSVIMFVYLFIKILLVAGGWDEDYNKLASTEIFDSRSWLLVGELSHPALGVRGARLGNTVFMTGELSEGVIITLL